MKQIEKSKARRLTYKRRLSCIKKKTMELATLCGINACLVCLGPNREVETWPEKPSDVRDVISKYKGPSEIESESETDLSDEKIEEVEKEIEAIKKENLGKILMLMQLKKMELPKEQSRWGIAQILEQTKMDCMNRNYISNPLVTEEITDEKKLQSPSVFCVSSNKG